MNKALIRFLAAAFVAFVGLVAATPSIAGFADIGGARQPAGDAEFRGPHAHVLPAQARPFGYSLTDMARLTAAFNTSDRSGPPPNSPFQILYLDTTTNNTVFRVKRGSFLYVPVVYSDNSPPLLGHFPADAEDRRQLLRYWYSQSEVGVVSMQIVVDGRAVALGARYVSGVRLALPLPNTATQYIVGAAFLAPLPRGRHSVAIYSKATGDALREPPFDEFFPDGVFESSLVYTVDVD